MKTTEFKVHSIYSKEDIQQMQKVVNRKMRTIGLSVSVVVFILYLAVLVWEWNENGKTSSLFTSVSGNVLNLILLGGLIAGIVVLAVLPRIQAKRILKDLPGGVLKANYYFYEKTFEYGWGNHFTSTGYVEIQEFLNLEKTFYIKARDVSYWIKKEDFEVGNAEDFLKFMEGKEGRSAPGWFPRSLRERLGKDGCPASRKVRSARFPQGRRDNRI